ncbi:hemerythrin domain-containing protein [Streptomyces sp. NPDC047028]|uniref:hemerythrin domain-containing protein n=1 Tax=Streptomyces sp. NPDC047028 TaxID=3155793 RepID=UPI0033F5F1F5
MESESGMLGELTADHQRIQRLFDQARSAAPGSAERTSLVERISISAVRHLVAEREHLHPTVRRYVVDGDDWVQAQLAEGRELEWTLSALEAADPRGEEFVELLLAAGSGVTRHVLEQEQLVFPRLQALCPPDVLRAAGSDVRPTEESAPTRPRPRSPRSAPLAKVTALAWGPLDRLRDHVTRRGRG